MKSFTDDNDKCLSFQKAKKKDTYIEMNSDKALKRLHPPNDYNYFLLTL